MDQNYTGISLVDLLAYFVKKFWVLLIGALAGMVLLLSYHYISSNSAKSIEEYENNLSKYKAELSSLESTLDNLNMKLEFYNEIESISPIYSSNQIYVSGIMISFDSDVISTSESGKSIVGQEISRFWNNLDLSSVVGSGLDSDVLKASIIFELSGLLATIRVYDEDKDVAERYATSIVDSFVSYFDGRKSLNLGSKTITTSVASKNEIALIREQIISDKTSLQTELLDTEAKIKTLEGNVPAKYHTKKNAVIGFLIGGVAVAGALGMGFSLHNPVTSSFGIEKTIAVPFLGAIFIDNGFFSKLARRIMVERSFTSLDDSIEYLRNSFSTKSFTAAENKKNISLMSSVDDKYVENIANKVMTLLKEEGYDVTFIGNSSENPLTMKTIENNEAVILLERQWISKMQLLSMNKDLAFKMDKKVLGFIIC